MCHSGADLDACTAFTICNALATVHVAPTGVSSNLMANDRHAIVVHARTTGQVPETHTDKSQSNLGAA